VCRIVHLACSRIPDKFEEFTSINSACVFPLLGEVPLIAGNNRAGAGKFGAFKDAVVCLVRRDIEYVMGPENDCEVGDGRQRLPDSMRI
jgi:hypothetical protein